MCENIISGVFGGVAGGGQPKQETVAKETVPVVDRDKVIEIISLACNHEGIAKRCPERIADHLIENGIGDISAEKHRADVAEEALKGELVNRISLVHFNKFGYYPIETINKEAKELMLSALGEAEQRLKRLKEEI